MHVEQCLFVNCAPFEHIHLNFLEHGMNVLSAINGGGKTTILSYIADAFHEIAKLHFPSSYTGKETQFYRLMLVQDILAGKDYCIAYIRFMHDGKCIDYISIRGNINESDYLQAIPISNPIPYQDIKEPGKDHIITKKVYRFDKTNTESIFYNNIITNFPAYRYEKPAFLNEKYEKDIPFDFNFHFRSFLPNPIDVISTLENHAAWILNIYLDVLMKEKSNSLDDRTNTLMLNARSIAAKTLNKRESDVKFAIGSRTSGPCRLGIQISDEPNYPSIFHMSSGEKACFSMFIELLRQADTIDQGLSCSGIVLIDEIDKHLHIKLQKETIPQLISLFPNIQFIVSSHSPFLHVGLSEASSINSQVIDLDHNGIIVPKMDNPLYKEVYDMMIYENQRFADKCKALESATKLSQKPIIITEGKTDIIHINKAKEKLGICDIDYETLPPEDCPNGDGNLNTLLMQLSRIKQKNVIIGIFDRDSNICHKIESEGAYKCYGNNVYAFCIPVPPHRVADGQKQISIEYLFTDDEVKSDVGNGTRLFFGTEFSDNTGRHLIENDLILSLQNGRGKDKIIENNGGQAVFDKQENNKLAKKADFTEAIRTERIQVSDASWQNFAPIFDTIRDILKHNTN